MSERWSCQGCKMPMGEPQTTLMVKVGRVILRFCCTSCLTAWGKTVDNQACHVCRAQREAPDVEIGEVFEDEHDPEHDPPDEEGAEAD